MVITISRSILKIAAPHSVANAGTHQPSSKTVRSGPKRVVLTADKSGSDVVLELRNRTDTPLAYNLYASALQRLNEGSWLNVPVEDESCTTQNGTLQPGKSVTYTKTLPEHLEVFGAGTYRYKTRVEQPPGTQVKIDSNSFNR